MLTRNGPAAAEKICLRNMKWIYLIPALAVMLLVSCKPGSGDPMATAKQFVAATNEGRFEDARKMVTPDYLPVLEYLEKQFRSMPEDARKQFRRDAAKHSRRYAIKTKNDDSAEVVVSGEDPSSRLSIIFSLRKVNGKWLIDGQEDNSFY